MVSFINAANKILSVLFSVLLFITGSANAVFNGDVAEWESSDGIVGIESLVRSQGVTNDGESLIFSGKTALERVNIKTGETEALNTDAIPEELSEKYNAKHIGGISYADGYVYAGVEDSKEWQHPLVVLYDAKTLEYTGICYEMSTELFTRGIPWVIADTENGVLYAASSRDKDRVFVFDLQNMTYLSEILFSQEIAAIQGGEYADGCLYFGTNDDTRAVYRVNVTTGAVEKLFDRIAYQPKLIDNFGGEGEDLTLYEAEDGTYIHTLQLGVTFTDATLRHYKAVS